VVARARAAGIARIVTISTRVKRHAEVLGIAERFDDVYCSVGTHPHYAHEELALLPGLTVFFDEGAANILPDVAANRPIDADSR
jgi:TatD DNase family protein